MAENVYYWPVDLATKIVSQDSVKADYRGGIHHVPRSALKVAPKPEKSGFAVIAVFDDGGFPVGSDYVEDHRGDVVYSVSDCKESKTLTDLGPVPDGWTKSVPMTEFDKWDGLAWVTDSAAKYEADRQAVDRARQSKYTSRVRPFLEEADIKNHMGLTDEYMALMDLAVQERQKIQQEEPWPEAPPM